MKRLTILAITLVFGIPIYASPMVWELSNVVFNEGGTATGFYTYDASTNTVSNWSINVFGGRSIVFPAYTYDLVTSYIPDPTLETDMNVFFFSKTVFCCGDSAAKRLIDISLNAPMTDAGGTIAMRTGINPTGSRECYNCAPARLAISGSITSVPEPSTIVLLMAALALLAFRVPRRGPAHVISLTVLMAAAFLHFGATPLRAQSDAMNGRLFVDRDRGRLGALCTNSDPCARITDALSMARAMRYGLDPAIPRLQPHKRINITVRASSTPYLGSPDPARLAANPNLEALPLFLNISDLDLAGESKFTRDTQGWIEENSVSDATIIKSEASLPGFLALILIGLSEGALADDVTVRGFVLDGNTQPSSAGILIGADRAQRFLIRDTYQINSTYGVVAQGSSGFVEQCFMSHLGEGVLVFGGNVTNWPSEVTVRNTRSIGNTFGGLAFFGSSFIVNGSSAVADFGAYKGVFQPVPFTGVVDRTVGHVIHNDLSGNKTDLTLTSGLRMALIGPSLPAGQSAGHLAMTVIGNRLNDNAHAFSIDAGFPFRSSPTDFTSSFTGWFEDNEATGSLTARALVTFTRNNAAETLPGAMATWKYLVNSSYQVMYSNGEFDEASGPSGRVWIDNPDVDPAAPGQALSSELILQAR